MNTPASKPSNHIIYLLLLVLSIPFWWSCGDVRKLQYMQGHFDTTKLSQATYPEPIIQVNELVTVNVYSDDPRASAYYNLPPTTTVSGTSEVTAGLPSSMGSGNSTYLVDQAGNIVFPGLGPLHVAGLTKDQLYKLLEEKVADKLKNPYFIIRLSSYRITMIGEVARPGQFTIPNEKVSLLEAIALAGDLTPFGRRDNVTIIREINGQRSWERVDLRKPEFLNSPYFYLQPNDVVIVDLTKNKASASDQVTVRNIALATSLLSVVAVLISVLQ